MLGMSELLVAKQGESTKLKVCVQKAVVKQLNSSRKKTVAKQFSFEAGACSRLRTTPYFVWPSGKIWWIGRKRYESNTIPRATLAQRIAEYEIQRYECAKWGVVRSTGTCALSVGARRECGVESLRWRTSTSAATGTISVYARNERCELLFFRRVTSREKQWAFESSRNSLSKPRKRSLNIQILRQLFLCSFSINKQGTQW